VSLNIKKSLVGLLVQLDTHVLNAHAHVSKAPDIRAIMGQQDMQASNIVNGCKACRHATVV
jgi:hypothetical protein